MVLPRHKQRLLLALPPLLLLLLRMTRMVQAHPSLGNTTTLLRTVRLCKMHPVPPHEVEVEVVGKSVQAIRLAGMVFNLLVPVTN